MNHKKIEQTLRYAKLSPENGRNAIQGLYKWENYLLKKQLNMITFILI
jgi:hypothetical protein